MGADIPRELHRKLGKYTLWVRCEAPKRFKGSEIALTSSECFKLGKQSVAVIDLQPTLHEFTHKSQSAGAGDWEAGGFNKKASNNEKGWLWVRQLWQERIQQLPGPRLSW